MKHYYYNSTISMISMILRWSSIIPAQNKIILISSEHYDYS